MAKELNVRKARCPFCRRDKSVIVTPDGPRLKSHRHAGLSCYGSGAPVGDEWKRHRSLPGLTAAETLKLQDMLAREAARPGTLSARSLKEMIGLSRKMMDAIGVEDEDKKEE